MAAQIVSLKLVPARRLVDWKLLLFSLLELMAVLEPCAHGALLMAKKDDG